jgi:lipopolysaccharide export LptBFGC system permease protein LptF
MKKIITCLVTACLLFVAGCTQQTTDDKLYLQKIEDPESGQKAFQIDEGFNYSQIVFKMYFTEDSNEWELVETYKVDKDDTNTFIIGYDDQKTEDTPYSDNQYYLIYGNDKKYDHQTIEMKNYEEKDGYNGGVTYFLEKKELSYNNEIPFYLSSFTKHSYENKETYSIPFNWEDYKIENMKMTDNFNCEGYSCYVYTVQLIH